MDEFYLLLKYDIETYLFNITVDTSMSEQSHVVHRPRNCHSLEPTVYNVASWHQLCGLKIVHKDLGVGEVTRTNCMSKKIWVRFNGTLKVVKMKNTTLPTEDIEIKNSDKLSFEF